MDCRQDVHDAYYERFDARHRDAWCGPTPAMTSWYKNAAGRVTTTSPWRLVDYWGWTKEPDLADYELRELEAASMPGTPATTRKRAKVDASASGSKVSSTRKSTMVSSGVTSTTA